MENLSILNKMPDRRNLYQNGSKKSPGHSGNGQSAGHQEPKSSNGKANGKKKMESEAASAKSGSRVAERT